MNAIRKLLLISVLLISLAACSKTNEAPIPSNSDADIMAYIITPSNGEVVSSPLRVIFGLKGMGVAPAGVDLENTGHHHLLIDMVELPDLTKPLPATDNLKHFGKGQTETLLELSPGTHTLQILLGNFMHVPHAKPVLSKKITITVE